MSPAPPPERSGEPSDLPSSLTDEQLAEFLRDAAGGGDADAPKEPSARARMVARRLREQDEAERKAQEAGGRGPWARRKRRAPAVPHGTPPGWRTGPAWQEMNGTRSRRRQVGAAVGILLAAALAVIAVRPSLLLDRIPGGGPEAGASTSRLPAETELPSSAPGLADPAGAPSREHPFRGSPALRWAEGADAIEVPEAKAVSGMSKADVELALRNTKKFLVAANLDPAVLRGGSPDRALALLEPKQTQLLADLRRALRKPTRENNPLTLFTRFDPDEVRLAGDVIKVRGHMTFTASRPGEVEVHADYTFVYPLVRADGDSDEVTRTIVRRDVTMTVSDPGRYAATRGKLLPERYTADYANSDCAAHDGFLHPAFADELRESPAPTGPTGDPYDRSRPLTADERERQECEVAART